MMQAGMFVSAKSFTSEVCDGIFTHHKREEDASMESGKWDEELSRMSEIVDDVKSNSLLLFNKSFRRPTKGKVRKLRATLCMRCWTGM